MLFENWMKASQILSAVQDYIMKQMRFRRILSPTLMFRAKPVAKNLFGGSNVQVRFAK